MLDSLRLITTKYYEYETPKANTRRATRQKLHGWFRRIP